MAKSKRQSIVATISRYVELLFITLRACDVIDWPWYIILSPVIVPLVILAVCAILAGIAAISDEL